MREDKTICYFAVFFRLMFPLVPPSKLKEFHTQEASNIPPLSPLPAFSIFDHS
jgi:hypothetical protein